MTQSNEARVNKATLALVQIMKTYLDSRQDRNKTTLQKKTGVPYTTISRILTMKSPTTFDTQMQILSAIASPQQKRDFIKKFHPRIFSSFQEMEQGDKIAPSAHKTRPSLLEHIKNQIHSEIIALLCPRNGIAKGQLYEMYGELSHEFLRQLDEYGLVEETQDNRVRLHHMPTDLSVVTKMIGNAARGMSNVAKETDNIVAGYFAEGISKKGVDRLAELAIEFARQYEEIVAECPGDHVMEVGLVAKPINVSLARNFSNKDV